LLTKNFPNLNKNLSDIEDFLECPYDFFLNFIAKDDLIMETERDVSELILNYIKSRRNVPEALNPLITNLEENKLDKNQKEEKDKKKDEKDEKDENDDEESKDEEESKKEDDGEDSKDEEKAEEKDNDEGIIH
jgi:hypothetical protein